MAAKAREELELEIKAKAVAWGVGFASVEEIHELNILHATGRNGGSISMRVCLVIKVGANGLINRIDEYFDPAELEPLL